MKIIVGLGNPGEKYKTTRHNAGWFVLDRFIMDLQSKREFFRGKEIEIENFKYDKNFEAEISESIIAGKKILFVKPQTFMNDSGKAVKEICDFYKADVAKDLLVIHDDTDLPLGHIRANMSANSAGHQGVQNVIDVLGTKDFHRIRIGVESRASRNDVPTDAFVLQNFSDEELKKLRDDVFPKVKLEIEKFLKK